MKKKTPFSKIASQTMDVLMAVCMFIVLCMVLLQIASRVFAIATTSWTDEVLRFFMMYYVFIGCDLLVATQEHVQLDIIPGLFKGAVRKIWNVAIHLVVIASSVGMIYGGYFWARGSTGFTPYLLIPLKYYYAIVPVSFGIVIYFSLCHIVNIIRKEDGNQPQP